MARLDYLVRWCPGYKGMEGNEAANAEAKAGALEDSAVDESPTLAHVRRVAKAQSRAALAA